MPLPSRGSKSLGIIDGPRRDTCRLAPEWEAFLKLAQDEGAEDLADDRQRERHQREREIVQGA